MAIKFICKCGVPLIAFTKQPGETITCNNCGKELTIPEQSMEITGVIANRALTESSSFSAQPIGETDVTQPISPIAKMPDTNHGVSSSEIAGNINPQQTNSKPKLQVKKNFSETSNFTAKPAPPPIDGDLPPTKAEMQTKDISECPNCGVISKSGAVICIECGTNLQTGKSYMPPPVKNRKSAYMNFLTPKNIGVIVRIAVILAIIIPTVIFSSQIIDLAKSGFSSVANLLGSSDKQVTRNNSEIKSAQKSYTEDDLDYPRLNKDLLSQIQTQAEIAARKEYLEKHPEENCYLRVLEKARELYPMPFGNSGKDVTFKTAKGITVKGTIQHQTNPNQITIMTDPSFAKTKTYQKNEIDPEYYYMFFGKECQEKYNKYIAEHAPDIEKQQKDYGEFKKAIEKKVFEKEGYAWSSKTSQWVPLKLKKDPAIDEEVVGSKKLIPVKREKLAPDDPRLPIQEAGININALINENPNVTIHLSIKMPKDYKKPMGTEIYRSRRKDGEYVLIHQMDLPTESSNNLPPYYVTFTDNFPLEEKSNNVYYRIHVFQDNYYREFSPVKVPVIKPLVIAGNSWSWDPIEKNGEPLDVLILEYLNIADNELYTFAESMQNTIVRDISNLPAKAPVKIKIIPKESESSILKNDFGIVTKFYFKFPFEFKNNAYTINIREGDKKAYKVSLIPSFINNDVFTNWSADFGDKAEKFSLDGKMYFFDRQTDKTKPFFLNSRPLCFTHCDINKNDQAYKINITNKKAEVYFDIFDRKTNKTVEKPVLKFQIPPSPPSISIKATNKGNIISWKKIPINKKDYLITPKLVIKGRGGIIYSGDIDATTTSFLDTAIKKGEKVHYNACLTDGVIKTQGWAMGVKQQDFLTVIRSFEGHSNTRVISNDESRGSEYIISQNDSQKLFIEHSDPIKGKPPIVVASVIPPLRIGLWEPDMCHEQTGLMEISLMDEISKSLLKEKDFVVFNRINKKAFLEESTLQKLYGKENQKYRYGLDFVVRLRDFSREEGNGVEVWLTQLGSNSEEFTEVIYSPPNINSSWRIGEVYSGQNNIDLGKTIISPLLAKIKELTKEKRTPVKHVEIIPKNIVFGMLQPIEQQSQVWQYKEISESLMLELAEKCPDQNILSRENWNTLIKEQTTLLDEGVKPEIIIGDIILTGNVWKVNGKMNFLIWATDLETETIWASLRTEGALDKVAENIAAWLKKLTKPELSPSNHYEQNAYAINREQAITSFKRFYHVDKYTPNESTLTNQFITNQFSQLNKKSGVESFEYLKEKNRNKIDSYLAQQYHDLGLYASEIKVYRYLASQPNVKNKAEILKRLERAKTLAEKSSPLLKLAVSKTPTAKRKVFSPDNPLPQNMVARLVNKDNPEFQELIHCARTQIGEEWNCSGAIMLKNIFCSGNKIPLSEYLKNKYGVWSCIQTLNSQKNKTYLRVWLQLWQSVSLTSPTIKTMYPEIEIQAIKKELAGDIRQCIELYKHPSTIIYEQGNKFTGKDFLKQKSNADYKLQQVKYWYIDNLFAADLYSKLDPTAKNIIDYAMKKKIPAKKLTDADQAFLIFQAFKGKEEAILKIIDHIKKDINCRELTQANSIFLFALTGREELLETILPKAESEDIRCIRWGNKEVAKNIIKKGVIKGSSYHYLVNGFSLTENTKKLQEENSEDSQELLVLLHGKPLEEIK